MVQIVDTYMARFIHVTEHYARQVPNERGSYVRVPEPLTREVVTAHLTGALSIGLYLLDAADRCAYGVLDHDGYQLRRDAQGAVQRRSEDGVAVLQEVRSRLAQEGIDTALESSRRGAHLWVFAAAPVPAADMRALMAWAAGGPGIELYPKQDRRGDGVGSNIRAPLGVHLASRQRYGFLDAQGELVAPTLGGQMEYLADVRTVDVAREVAQRPALRVAWAAREACDGPTVRPAAPGPPERAGTPSAKDGSAIRAWLEAVRCDEVVRAYVTLDRRGVGHCPWPEHHAHGDRAASFQVLSRAQRWICYATGETGNAFDFVCRMETMMPKVALAYCLERWPAHSREGHGRG